jgi:hypothetical protein
MRDLRLRPGIAGISLTSSLPYSTLARLIKAFGLCPMLSGVAHSFTELRNGQNRNEQNKVDMGCLAGNYVDTKYGVFL